MPEPEISPSPALTDRPLRLLADDPALVDLLGFEAIARTITDALLDVDLDPIALGLSGTWGSGKSTVLNLIEHTIASQQADKSKVLVVRTVPWRYDPAEGAKASFIGDVLGAVAVELDKHETKSDKAKKLIKSLAARVDWAKAIKMAATTAVTLQLPNAADLVDLVKPKSDKAKDARGLAEFRSEFKELMALDELKDVRTVVVLIDDLDRCLPTTVVETLEAMRLFLDVPKMSFVIAADELRVAEAISTHFDRTNVPDEESTDFEDPSRLYLHKIVQTSFSLPALSSFDTLSYLLLLTLTRRNAPQFDQLVTQCVTIRREGGSAEDLTPIEGMDFASELTFASRVTPILHEKLHGNPRRIKRFLNDLEVRLSVANRRGIELNPAVIAKLMVLESILDKDFERLLGWFGAGELREKLARLESIANGTPQPDGEPAVEGEFSDALIRWAKLDPAVAEINLAPYLTLAASFAGVFLVDTKLPERLRDLASGLLSDSRRDTSAATDAALDGLGEGDRLNLIEHLGRVLRDQPNLQKTAVASALRLARRYPDLVGNVAEALQELNGRDVALSTPLLFHAGDDAQVFAVLDVWDASAPEMTKRAIANAKGQQG